MGMHIAFWVLALTATGAALGVIFQQNLFRAALMLVVCFLATAGIFVTLSADFLAAVQLIINVGAVAILIIMSIMLTREVTRGNPGNRLAVPAFMSASLLGLVIIFSVITTSWPVSSSEPLQTTTAALAHLLLGQEGFVLLVQMSALLMLATIIGAIVLLRENK